MTTRHGAYEKKAVRKLAGVALNDPLVLDDEFNLLKPGARPQLRVRVNEELKDEARLPNGRLLFGLGVKL